MNRAADLVGMLDANMITRNQREFWALFRACLVNAAISTVHRNTYKYGAATSPARSACRTQPAPSDRPRPTIAAGTARSGSRWCGARS